MFTKIFVDDVRMPPGDPSGWVIVRNCSEFFNILNDIDFDNAVISLDHDLGEDCSGYDIIKELERLHFLGVINLCSTTFKVHSQNPVGAQNIKRAISAIKRQCRGAID